MTCDSWAAWIEAIGTWAAAGGTLCAVLVALFGDALRRVLYPPKLRLELLAKAVHTTTTGDKKEQIWWSILVSNERKYSPAKRVRIMAEAFQKRLPDGSPSPKFLPTPLQLHWVYPQFHELLPNIGPKRRCNLGYLDREDKRFALSTYFVPNNFQGYVAPDDALAVRVVAVADNFESKPYFFEISWDGQWWSEEEDETQQHLTIQPVPSAGSGRTT